MSGPHRGRALLVINRPECPMYPIPPHISSAFTKPRCAMLLIDCHPEVNIGAELINRKHCEMCVCLFGVIILGFASVGFVFSSSKI